MEKIKSITISQLKEQIKDYVKFKIVNPKVALEREIRSSFINIPGLVLTGYFKSFTEFELQLFGLKEVSYLTENLTKEKIKIIEKFAKFNIPAIIVSDNLKLPDKIIDIFTKNNISVLSSKEPEIRLLEILKLYLEDIFAPTKVISGVLMDVFGVGVLLIGEGAIGKSECALELIERKHRFVADDAVVVKRKEETIIGYALDSPLKFHLELRGAGILDIKSLFGVKSVRDRKRIEIVIKLMPLQEAIPQVDRSGLKVEFYSILDVKIPLYILPVSPGKNVAQLVEGIAIKYISELTGGETAKKLSERLKKFIKSKSHRKLPKFEIDDYE